MKNYEEKEKKLSNVLKKLNTMSNRVIKMNNDINSLNQEKNQFSSKQKSYTPFSISKIPNDFISHFERSQDTISKIKRCSKCVLPSTFPFIEYDENGICYYYES